MKRYMSSVLIIVVILLTIGTYYVKVTSYASTLPKFTFKTVEGDEKELKPVIVNGDYQKGNELESFSIEANKIKYTREMSYYKNLFGFQYPDSERLVKEHRSFMRGKNLFDPYYEDQDNLTFVTVNFGDESKKIAGHFNIDILEKKTKDEKSFEIEVPEQERYQLITVLDIQFVQSKLQLITQNYVTSNDEKDTEEIHLYTIDLAGKKIAIDEMLLSETFDSSNQGSITIPTKVNERKANNVFVLALVKGSYSEEGEFKEQKGESSLFAYHYDTKKLEKIKVPKEVDLTYQNVQNDFSYDEENYYFKVWGEETQRIFVFDIDKQKIINDYTVDSGSSTTIKDGRIYALTNGEVGKLLIVDVKTGKTLYKGKMVIDSNELKKNKNQSIYLNEVYIK